jgi:tetratricopeptide (TPR) repeat protein
MLKPRGYRLFLYVTFCCLSWQSVVPAADFFRQTQRVPPNDSVGIDLFERGDDQGAIKALREVVKKEQANVRAQHYLGLALERQGKTGDARKAFEKAAKLGDAWLETIFLKMGNGDDTRLFRLIHEPLVWAVASARKYIALTRKFSKGKQREWNERLQSLVDFEELSDERTYAPGQRQVFSGKEVTTKARVLSKPEPTYTEEARKNQITGTVVLVAIFALDGKVKAIRAIKTLPGGLTEMAMVAARQIRFVPALKDGKPVSMFMHLEYNFNLY